MLQQLGFKGQISRIWGTYQPNKNNKVVLKDMASCTGSAPQWEDLCVKLGKLPVEYALWGWLYPLQISSGYIPGMWGTVENVLFGNRAVSECMYGLAAYDTGFKMCITDYMGCNRYVPYNPKNVRGGRLVRKVDSLGGDSDSGDCGSSGGDGTHGTKVDPLNTEATLDADDAEDLPALPTTAETRHRPPSTPSKEHQQPVSKQSRGAGRDGGGARLIEGKTKTPGGAT